MVVFLFYLYAGGSFGGGDPGILERQADPMEIPNPMGLLEGTDPLVPKLNNELVVIKLGTLHGFDLFVGWAPQKKKKFISQSFGRMLVKPTSGI